MKADSEASAEWLYVRANCERQLRQYEYAIASYGRLLEEHADSRFAKPATYERALVYYGLDRMRSAIDQIKDMEPVAFHQTIGLPLKLAGEVPPFLTYIDSQKIADLENLSEDLTLAARNA